jgi:hypothetical protein
MPPKPPGIIADQFEIEVIQDLAHDLDHRSAGTVKLARAVPVVHHVGEVADIELGLHVGCRTGQRHRDAAAHRLLELLDVVAEVAARMVVHDHRAVRQLLENLRELKPDGMGEMIRSEAVSQDELLLGLHTTRRGRHESEPDTKRRATRDRASCEHGNLPFSFAPRR